MVSSTMDLPIKRTLSLSIKLCEELSGLFSTDKKWEILQDVYTKQKFFNVYEMFNVEVVKEVFKQLRLESPRVYLDTSLGGHDYDTKRKQKGLLPSTYKRL